MTKRIGLIVAALIVAATAGLFWWKSAAQAVETVAPVPAGRPVATVADEETADDPPAATAKTREEKRFARYDKDKDGSITRDEYLLARRKAYAKLDANGDGALSFEEYAVKTSAKFAGADADRSRMLNPAEFATTKVVRKKKAAAPCSPPRDED